MAKVAITEVGQLDPAPAIAALQAAGHEVVFLDSRDATEAVRRASDAEALLVAFAPVPAEVIAALPQLRIIATASVGFNHIDTAAAADRGILVCNIPSVASEEVATHALAGALHLLRELGPSAAHVREGGWNYSAVPLPPRVSELTLGLYGLGKIARELALRALPLFGRVVAYDPFVPADAWLPGVERADSLEGLLRETHVLSLHAPATPETRGVINAQTLAQLPAQAYLINVARGDLVNEADLIAALESGHVRAAFLDVTDPEPPVPGAAITQHPRVMVTPHSAFRSAGSVRDYLMIPVSHLLAALAGERPGNVVAGPAE